MRVRQQHDPLADPQQRARRDRRRQCLAREAQFGQPARMRGAERGSCQLCPQGLDGRADRRRQRGAGIAAVQPPLSAAQLPRRPGERVDEGPVRQAEQPAGRLGGQTGLQRVFGRVPFDLGLQPLPQCRPVGRVGQPVTRDRRGGCRHSHRRQLGGADETAPSQLRRAVRPAGHVRQHGGPGPGGSAPDEARGSYVQDGRRAGCAPAARFAQDGAVAHAQGQRAAQGQSGRVPAERTEGHRHRGGADVQGERPGQLVGRRSADPHVDQAGEQPAVRGQQHLAAVQRALGRAVHVDGHARHPADGGDVLVQALQCAHPERGRAVPRHQAVADAQGARAQGAGDDGAVPAHGEGAVQPQP
ncbi:hypothetical protein ACWCPM_16920 [Streptomyces sp. NPDC002309]